MLIFKYSVDSMMRVLVIGSCGKRKRFSSPEAPTCSDLIEKSQMDEWVSKLSGLTCKARDMYTGNQSRELVGAVDFLRKIKGVQVALYIISAGFGILEENDIIPPYECSFSGMRKSEIRQRSSLLSIRDDFDKICNDKYELSYVALGSNYRNALEENWQDEIKGSIIAFGKKTTGDNLLSLPCNAEIVKALSSAGQKIHGIAGFKGDLLRILATYTHNQQDSYSEIASWTNLDNVRNIVQHLARKS
ncbi:MAG: hypothetical protein KAR33_08770 [Candidatus Thorarchaeota archaeon]|nr:hypothetical protein [Candidatus Thorarchaeota archaeon]